MIGLWLALAASAGTARLGLFVGNNLGFGTDEPLAYAEDEARRMSRILQEMGDLQRERTTVLQGARAADLARAIQQVEGQVREVVARGDDALLFFYYSGHASREGLHMSGSLFALAELQRWLEGSAADVRVAFVDACESGSLVRARGGTPVEHVQVEVDDRLTASGLAIVSSTGPLSVAREAAAFGGGVFSRALVTGLRGSADQDADGQITLDEAYRYAFEQTVASTARSGSSIQRPEYRYAITGVGQVVLTRLPTRAAALTLPEELEGVYTVVSVGTGRVVARVDKQPGEQHRLALPAGRYVVRKVRQADVLLAELDLVWGGERWVADAQMSSVAIGDPMARGGWQPRPLRVSARASLSSPHLLGSPVALGGELAVRGRLKRHLSLSAVAGGHRGSRYEWTGRLLAESAYAGLGLFAEHTVGPFDLWAGAGPAVARLRQEIQVLDVELEEVDGVVYDAAQWVGGGFASAGAHLPVGPGFGLEAGVRLHLFRAEVDLQPRAISHATVQLGGAFRFRTRRVARARRSRGDND